MEGGRREGGAGRVRPPCTTASPRARRMPAVGVRAGAARAQCEHRLPAHTLSRSSDAVSSVPRPRTHVTVPAVTSPNRVSSPPPHPPGNGTHAQRELRAVPAAASRRRRRASRRPPPSFPPLAVTCSRACALPPSRHVPPSRDRARGGGKPRPLRLSFEAKISRIGKKIFTAPHTYSTHQPPLPPIPAAASEPVHVCSVGFNAFFPSISPLAASPGPQGHLRSTHCFPPSSYSCLEIHICWNVPCGESGAFSGGPAWGGPPGSP